MKLILTGFSGSGKTTTAEALSEQLSLPLFEMDQMILDRSGRESITEIFDQDGESAFRQMEGQLVEELADVTFGVISTGGAVGANAEQMAELKRNGGIAFYLHTKFHTIASRLEGDITRPMMRTIEEGRRLYAERVQRYLANSDHTIETDPNA